MVVHRVMTVQTRSKRTAGIAIPTNVGVRFTIPPSEILSTFYPEQEQIRRRIGTGKESVARFRKALGTEHVSVCVRSLNRSASNAWRPLSDPSRCFPFDGPFEPLVGKTRNSLESLHPADGSRHPAA